MYKGLLLGILLHSISATGYLMIVNVTSIISELFRTGLMICLASFVALIVVAYTLVTGQELRFQDVSD